MQWHIICQIGDGDNFAPPLQDDEPRLVIGIDKPSSPLLVRNHIISEINSHGLTLSETAIDLVYLALAVFTADVRVKRAYAEDSWTREFVLHLPVYSLTTWKSALPVLSQTLSFLTGDRWEFDLRSRESQQQGVKRAWSEALPQAVTLFSGGLDSFIGAIDLLEKQERVALVGQYGSGTPNSTQERVRSTLETAYSGQTTPLWFYVQPSSGEGEEFEETMRSRSIVFLALGTAVAGAIGPDIPLFVPENGLISLNVPLTFARMGSLSTRTTHPYFISLYRSLLSSLGLNVGVELPYRFKTKGEMLREARNEKVLRLGARQTMSCSHPSAKRFQKQSERRHCGYCVPCIIRRAAMKVAGLDFVKDYDHDVRVEGSKPDSAKGRDVRAFQIAIERIASLHSMEVAAEVLHSGPLPPEDVGEYAGVYQRGLIEVGNFLNGNRTKRQATTGKRGDG